MSTPDSLPTSASESAFAALRLHSLFDAVPAQPHFPSARPTDSVPALWPRQRVGGLRVSPPQSAPVLEQDVLRLALRHINENLDGRLTWEEIAGAVGMNHFRLGRVFRLCTGMTLHQYVTQCRIRRARHLLLDAKMSLADIALEVGFSCQSHLTTQFRKHTGTTPGAFRRTACRDEGAFATPEPA